ncbi:M23 family metallopeptidase [Saccharopolyspora sp. CA-218241]|uniref:M23 family metallopeptidase n=1 Tax=Saccharopolyspora sp. CA-218241 TaxID=3240027 RepID=UPI003D992571
MEEESAMAFPEKPASRGFAVLSLLGALCSVTAPQAVADVHSAHVGSAPDVPSPGSRRSAPPAASALTVHPVTTGVITSGFGPRGGTMHKGVDIANAIGTPIHAAADGTVVAAGPARGFGRWIRIAHGSETVSVYGHINAAFVSTGQRVAGGQLIASMGNRGQSTGPHLHFQLEVRGQAVDPALFYRDAGASLRW